jgi:glutathione S-transferase
MKMPFIEIDGRKIGDSTAIIDHLKDLKGDLLDGNLTPLQKAHAVAYQRLLEENVAPAMVYHRWQTDHGWDRFSRILFRRAPALVRILIGGRLRKKTIKALYSQGMGRHSEAEVLEILRKDLRALAEFLGENHFFFGEKPSTLDCVAFGVLGNLFSDANLLLQGLGSEFPNLKTHTDRMHELFQQKASVHS